MGGGKDRSEDEGKQNRKWMRAETEAVFITAKLGSIPLLPRTPPMTGTSQATRWWLPFISQPQIHGCWGRKNTLSLERLSHEARSAVPVISAWIQAYWRILHGVLVHPSLLRPADKPFSCCVEISHFPSLLCLGSTLVNPSQTAGCVLKSIDNGNGQVIVCGELSFLLRQTMEPLLLCPVGSLLNATNVALPGPRSSLDCRSQSRWWSFKLRHFRTGSVGLFHRAGNGNILCGMEKFRNAHSIHSYSRYKKYLHENGLFLSCRSS